MKHRLLVLLMLVAAYATAQTPDSVKTAPPPDSLKPSPSDSIAPLPRSETSGTLKAARSGNGRIMGTLIEGEANKPVEFATVALYTPLSNVPIGGTTTDEQGKFTLNNVAPGTYRVMASFNRANA